MQKVAPHQQAVSSLAIDVESAWPEASADARLRVVATQLELVERGIRSIEKSARTVATIAVVYLVCSVVGGVLVGLIIWRGR